MTEAYKKLIATLEEIFQLDQADLDFGIYRIMNQKRDEINDFLKNKLLTQVNETLSKAGNQDGEALKKELENLERTLREAIVDPDTNPKVKELRARYASAGSPEALTNEVFSHLTSFFRRYYNQGDFISQRRYKKDVYAIPYEGEEVKLHWANHDQYYIKTGENFKNYTFKTEGGKTVHFALREANTEQNNNKAQQGKERRFKLAEQDIFTENGNELTIWFTYEPTDKKEKQDDLNKASIQTITANLPETFKTSLLQNKGTKSNPGRTLLEKHLNDYTARNTFDYFIHKDLGGFLRRELDFYIKNEILQIDDINLDDPQSFDRQLKVIKALKTVAGKIIALLAQLEDFQKRLWLKKKFVMQSDYCITLDRVPESLYPDIIANTAQIEEWKRLFAIDEIKADTVTLPYTEPLTIDFLKGNPFLVLDTAFFGQEWKYKLLASIENIDEQCDGLLINSENFQALNLISYRYKESTDCIYNDPPYNAKSSEILYKNSFKHSSWITLIENRLALSKILLKKDFVNVTAIDEIENFNLGKLIEDIFTDCENSCISIVHNPTGQQGSNFSYTHEFAHFSYPSDGDYIGLEDRDDKTRDAEPDIRPLRNVSSGKDHLRESAANCFYPIYVKDGRIVGFGDVCDDDFHPNSINIKRKDGTIEIYPIDPSNIESKWVFARNTVESILDELTTEYDKKKGIWDIIRRKSKFRYKSLWSDKRYSANSWGSVILNNMIPKNPFAYPKSIYTVMDCLDAGLGNRNHGLLLDYFAGSGTTGHAVIKLNRSDNGKRKYILVEMGEYFNTVTKPRIQKVIYSEDWKDGKPVSRKGSSHCFKYLRLESYEDTLNNLQLQRSQTQQSLLADPDFGEEYLLHYMLNVESRESLLNLGLFKRPFGYTLKVTKNNELQPQEVDMVETFNYLIGLVVETTQIIKGNVVIEGRNLQGDKILVIWRDVEVTDNAALDEFFKKLSINTKDSEFKRIYVNGDNNLENLRMDGEQWKVVLIEEEFHKRMFDVKDV
jgi:adenine-specific DNA-methyltransferase